MQEWTIVRDDLDRFTADIRRPYPGSNARQDADSLQTGLHRRYQPLLRTIVRETWLSAALIYPFGLRYARIHVAK